MKSKLLALSMAAAFILVGCETAGPKTKEGAVAGGLLGAAAGGIIGHQKHRGLEGAGIGAAVGAIGGALVGSAMDDRDRQALAVNPDHIPLTKIAEMASQGTPDSVIIDEMQRTHSVYNLDSETITYLKHNKVNDRVIDYMLATGK